MHLGRINDLLAAINAGLPPNPAPGWRNLVDARDLKSLETLSRAGSSPAPGTKKIKDLQLNIDSVDVVKILAGKHIVSSRIFFFD